LADSNEAYPFIRKLLPFTTMAVVIALLYVAWTFYSRWQEARDLRRKAAQQQVEDARRTIEAYGNGRVKIMSFSGSLAVNRGEKAELCYGVSNAKTVTIEPRPDEAVWPSLARCVSVSPKKTTTYTLTASDRDGHSEQESRTIQVQ
jgi:hypothetical protein